MEENGIKAENRIHRRISLFKSQLFPLVKDRVSSCSPALESRMDEMEEAEELDDVGHRMTFETVGNKVSFLRKGNHCKIFFRLLCAQICGMSTFSENCPSMCAQKRTKKLIENFVDSQANLPEDLTRPILELPLRAKNLNQF